MFALYTESETVCKSDPRAQDPCTKIRKPAVFAVLSLGGLMPKATVTCVGAAHWDNIAQAVHPMRRGDDVPGRIQREPGGVALNIAFGTARQGVRTQLLAALGRDRDGDTLLSIARLHGIDTQNVLQADNSATDQYSAIEGSDGELFAAVSDDSTLETYADQLFQPYRIHGLSGTVVLDGNLPQRTLDMLASSPILRHADLRLVPASPVKAPRMIGLLKARSAMIYANLSEANAVLQGTFATAKSAATALVEQGAKAALVTNGPHEACYVSGQSSVTAAPPPIIGGSVTGAGDALAAAHIASQLRGRTDWDALNHGLQAATTKIKER